jgi:hypothetical protein
VICCIGLPPISAPHAGQIAAESPALAAGLFFAIPHPVTKRAHRPGYAIASTGQIHNDSFSAAEVATIATIGTAVQASAVLSAWLLSYCSCFGSWASSPPRLKLPRKPRDRKGPPGFSEERKSRSQ